MIPKWATELKYGRHTYNARTETVAEKPSSESIAIISLYLAVINFKSLFFKKIVYMQHFALISSINLQRQFNSLQISLHFSMTIYNRSIILSKATARNKKLKFGSTE